MTKRVVVEADLDHGEGALPLENWIFVVTTEKGSVMNSVYLVRPMAGFRYGHALSVLRT